MVELKCEWLDVGSWPALENVVDLDDAGNAVIAENAEVARQLPQRDRLARTTTCWPCWAWTTASSSTSDATLVCNKSDCNGSRNSSE